MRLLIKQSDILSQEVEHADVVVIELKPTATVAVDEDRYSKNTYLLEAAADDASDFALTLADKSFTI